MPCQPDRDGRRTVVVTCALLLAPIVCCGLPLLIAGGALAGIGSLLNSAWLVGLAVIILAVATVIAWRARRR